MQQFLITCKHLLSKKSTGIIFLIIAISTKIILQVTFFNLLGDKSNQLLAGKNLLEGNGISINEFLLDDLSQEKFTPLVGWPPGYSLLISPLLWLFNSNYFAASIFFDIFCVFPFFFYLIKLINFFSPTAHLKNLFILFAGFYLYPVTSNGCTDMISLSCIMAGFYYLLQLMHKEEKSFRLLFCVSISFFLAGFFRYNYIPVALCSPVLLVLAGKLNYNKLWVKSGYKIGIILGLLFAALLVFQKIYTGAPTYVSTGETGYFPENILKTYPIVPASLADVEVAHTVFSNLTGISYLIVGDILRYINLLLFFSLLYLGIRKLKKVNFLLQSKEDYFFYLGIGISISVAGLLFYFSLRNSSFYSVDLPQWTFVQELRYFSFIVVFIQLLVFVFLFNKFSGLSLFWKKIAIICATVMLLGSLQRVYYVAKLLFSSEYAPVSPRNYIRETVPVLSLIKKIKSQYQEHEIIVASPDGYVCNYALLQNMKAVRNPTPEQLGKAISYSKPAILFIAIPANKISLYGTMLKNPSLNYYGEIDSNFYYTLEVMATEQ